MHGALTTWRLRDGTSAADLARAAAERLASADPAGVVGAFLQQTAPDAAALAGLTATLAGQAEPGVES